MRIAQRSTVGVNVNHRPVMRCTLGTILNFGKLDLNRSIGIMSRVQVKNLAGVVAGVQVNFGERHSLFENVE